MVYFRLKNIGLSTFRLLATCIGDAQVVIISEVQILHRLRNNFPREIINR
jgi:hypothetical protein